jgi:DNA-binding HxlR family transcriptional regulator
MQSWEKVAGNTRPLTPSVPFRICPIEVISGILGKKWALLILRDIGLLKVNRFNQILRSLPGLTPRVLTLRLRELENSGLISAMILTEKPRIVEWGLTRKGWDTIPILMDYIAFGAKWYPDEIFTDHQARTIAEIYPGIYSEPSGSD